MDVKRYNLQMLGNSYHSNRLPHVILCLDYKEALFKSAATWSDIDFDGSGIKPRARGTLSSLPM